MKSLLFILLSALAISPGVMAQDMFRLKALAPELTEANGREYVRLSNEELIVELAYDCMLEDLLLFDLVIINETDRPVKVNPLSFYYLKLDDPEGDTSRFPPSVALAPQKPFTWYDRALEGHQAENIFSPILEIPALFMEEIASAWGSSSQTHKLKEKERIQFIKETVRQEMLQEKEVAPGEVANGFIYFPGLPETIYLLFCFPLGDCEYQFAYELERNRYR